ncbi:unnamed protein product [Diatraea saccharalis]|uniref:Centromere protein S n=1 Tax=Diatraea saccharalis TaxID=40085 RepID=A0A9N9QZK6_9NEOP|nr:unnamed protein product [Diatraea saccharalis]
MEIISELVYRKISVYGSDLEAFAKHAKRSTINSEDVKLLTRRNPSLKAHLNALVLPSSAVKDKRRKTDTKQSETPAKPTEPEKEDRVKVDRPKRKTDEFEDMTVDDTIDLTFD